MGCCCSAGYSLAVLWWLGLPPSENGKAEASALTFQEGLQNKMKITIYHCQDMDDNIEFICSE